MKTTTAREAVSYKSSPGAATERFGEQKRSGMDIIVPRSLVVSRNPNPSSMSVETI